MNDVTFNYGIQTIVDELREIRMSIDAVLQALTSDARPLEQPPEVLPSISGPVLARRRDHCDGSR